MESLKKAISAVGSVSGLAEKLGVSQPAVSNWIKRNNVPVEQVLKIEKATGGKVTRYELRPDIYPPEAA